MKTFFTLALCFVFFSSIAQKHIALFKIWKTTVNIKFDDSVLVKHKIEKEKGRRCFIYHEANKIYLDVDKYAQWTTNIDSLFKVKTIRPLMKIGEPMQVAYLVFVIDETGSIIDSGFERNTLDSDYQKEFIRLLNLVECKLIPAEVNNKKVGSIVKFQVNYNKLID